MAVFLAPIQEGVEYFQPLQKAGRQFVNIVYPRLKPWAIENDITIGNCKMLNKIHFLIPYYYFPYSIFVFAFIFNLNFFNQRSAVEVFKKRQTTNYKQLLSPQRFLNFPPQRINT